MTNKTTARARTFASRNAGMLFMVAAIMLLAIAFERPLILNVLRPGDAITATFARKIELRDNISDVKIAGVRVGTVSAVSLKDDGTSVVSLKLQPGVTSKLGSAPTASIRPATILGGKFYIELAPGGDRGTFDGDIPVSRTRVAVELGPVVQSIQPDARIGMQQFVGKTDATLRQGGSTAITDLAHHAPASLVPIGLVFDSLAGDRPDNLRELVTSLNDTARTLNQQSGQVQSILVNLNASARVFDEERVPISDTVGQLPDTLRTTRTGMTALGGSLTKLTGTAGRLEPTAKALRPLLHSLNPLLVNARPVISDLRDMLTDTRPLVDSLVPTSRRATDLLGDLQGKVLDNVNGPIMDALNSPWRGEGPYKGNSSPFKLYQDIAYAITNSDSAASRFDANGHLLAIDVGSGLDDLADFRGIPNLEPLLRGLTVRKGGPR